ncbi:MAG: hypothetical protein GX589_05350 [Deltaproteobacteria bacterium]|nr:hypothetical protein [Deltaproteobacteria bacterium]
MSDDERVAGAKIAAKILNSMPAAKKKQLLEAIREKSAETYRQIEENILEFEDIVEIEERGVQLLIKEIEHRDLVLSLKLASTAVKAALFKGMSQNKAKVVKEDFEALPPTPRAEVEAAQKRIVLKIDELRTAGLIITGPEEVV